MDARCRHCQTRKACKHRKGLCHRCGTDREVSTLYVSTSKYSHRGHASGVNWMSPPLPTPTRTIPGTEEHMAVLSERASRGEAMFHPDDRPTCWD